MKVFTPIILAASLFSFNVVHADYVYDASKFRITIENQSGSNKIAGFCHFKSNTQDFSFPFSGLGLGSRVTVERSAKRTTGIRSGATYNLLCTWKLASSGILYPFEYKGSITIPTFSKSSPELSLRVIIQGYQQPPKVGQVTIEKKF